MATITKEMWALLVLLGWAGAVEFEPDSDEEDGCDCGSVCGSEVTSRVELPADADRNCKPVARFAVGLPEGDF